MKDFSFIHAADLHLDSPLKGLKIFDKSYHSLLQAASRSSLDRLVKEALKRQVNFVLICGDLLDGAWRDVRTGIYLCARLRELADAGIRTFIVSGNHDAVSLLSSSLELHKDVTKFPEEQPFTVLLEDLRVALHGRSYPQQHVGHEFVQSYPQACQGYFNIGLLHTSLEGDDGYAPCTPATLETKGYNYWALGHVHTFEIVSRSPWIVYPGVIQGRSVREHGSKGVAFVKVKAGEVSELTHIATDTVRWCSATLHISTCESLSDILAVVKEALQNLQKESDGRVLVVRLTLEGFVQPSVELEKGIREIPFSVGGNITLERIIINTSQEEDVQEVSFSLDGPLERLHTYKTKMKNGSSEFSAALLEELEPILMRKLPYQYFAPENGGLKNNSERVQEIMQRAAEKLIITLQGGER
jgi:DNA repair protein SbcD/Mre11